MRYFPYLTGLAGCFLPEARFFINGDHFTVRVGGNYTGWFPLLFILVFAFYAAFNYLRKKPLPPFLQGLIGIYLIVFALISALQTFSIFSGSYQSGLTEKLNASAMPGEGLLLLAITGFWFLAMAFKPAKI